MKNKAFTRFNFKKNIAFYVNNCKGAGAQIVTLRICKELSKYYNIYIIINEFKGELCSEFAEYNLISLSNKKISMLDKCFYKLKNYRHKRKLLIIKDIIIKYNLDLIFTSLYMPNIVALQLKYIFNDKIAVIPIIHGNIDINDNDILLYNKSDYIVGVSEGILEELVNKTGYTGKKAVINNPFSIHNYRKINNKKKKILVAVGRLEKVKGFDFLIYSIKDVLKKYDYKLMIYGNGKEKENLESIITEYKLSNYVELKGYEENIYSVYNEADALLVSSEREPFGNTIVEALSVGCPVISVDCPYGPKEILKDERVGSIVPQNNKKALSDAVEKCINEYYDHNFIIKYSKKYSPLVISEEYNKIIKHLI